MNKKFISAILAGLMLASTAVVCASADEVEVEAAGAEAAIELSGDSGKIRFDMGDWNHDDNLAFYIWAEKEGEASQFCTAGEWGPDAKWGSKKNKGTKVEGEDGIYESFEFEMLDSSWNVFVIFHDLTTDAQTADCVITANAFGDTAYMTGETVENPVDSDKVAIDVAFQSAGDCGSHQMVTSTGNITGRVLAPNDNPAKMVANYVTKQLGVVDKNGEECVTKDKVASAIATFGTDADSVWAEVPNTENYKAEDEAKYKEMINPSSAGDDSENTDNTDSEKKDSEKDDDDDDNNSSKSGSSSTSGSTSSKAAAATGTGTTSKAATGTTGATASAEAGAATGDTTGTAAFAVVLVAAAAVMFLARKKVED